MSLSSLPEKAARKLTSQLSPFRRKMRRETLRIVRENGVEPWFEMMPWERAATRYLLITASRMTDPSLPAHDIGCGIGQIMILLSRRGFTDLTGCDRAPNYIAAGEDLCAQFGLNPGFHVSDGRAYVETISSGSAGLILAVNWLYNLNWDQHRRFLQSARQALIPSRGHLVLDIIQSDYSPPEHERETYDSSYRWKWSAAEFEATCRASGFQIVTASPTYEWGRRIYWLRRPD